MSRPSSHNRQALEGEVIAKMRSGKTPTSADVVTAVLLLAEQNERQADALAYRYWRRNVKTVQADIDRGDVGYLDTLLETPYQDVGRSLNPPASRSATTDLVNRALSRMLSILAKLPQRHICLPCAVIILHWTDKRRS